MQIIDPSAKTMSTREIAALLDNAHGNVKISADRLEKSGTIALQRSNFNHNGNIYVEYHLTKRDSLILVAQNSPEFTAKIVDRWQELEDKELQPSLPENYIQALEALVASEKDKQAAQLQLQQQRPIVAIYDSLCNRKDSVSTTELAKKLGLRSAQQLNKFLREKRIKFLTSDLPQAPYSEWFSVVDVKVGDGDTFKPQTLITPKGQIEITRLWHKHNKTEVVA